MDNPRVIRELVIRADTQLLDLLSRIPSIWDEIASQLQNQHIWYLRVLELYTLPQSAPAMIQGQWNNKLNWDRIYHILASVHAEGSTPLALLDKEVKLTLKANKYHPDALRILIQMGLITRENIHNMVSGAARYGTEESLYVLIDDPELEDYGLAWGTYGTLDSKDLLKSAIRSASPSLETVKYLLEKSIVTQYLLGAHLLKSAFDDALMESKSLLLVQYLHSLLPPKTLLADPITAGIAVGFSTPEILTYLEQVGVFKRNDRSLKELALRADNLDNLKWLLGEDPGAQRRLAVLYFFMAISNSAAAVLRWMLTFPEVTKDMIRGGIGDAYARLDSERMSTTASLSIVSTLLSDKRIADEVVDILLAQERLVEGTTKMDRFLKSVMRADVPFSRLPRRLRRELTASKATTLLLTSTIAGVRLEEVRDMIEGADESDYNRSHFELLLREMTFKSPDPRTCFEWMLRQLRRAGTDSSVKQVIYQAAQSIIHPKEAEDHTSPYFTAYSGYFLFSLTYRKRTDMVRMLDLLRREGASERGLRLARILLAATMRA